MLNKVCRVSDLTVATEWTQIVFLQELFAV